MLLVCGILYFSGSVISTGLIIAYVESELPPGIRQEADAYEIKLLRSLIGDYAWNSILNVCFGTVSHIFSVLAFRAEKSNFGQFI